MDAAQHGRLIRARYFRNHPQDVQRYCWQNDRYVFFQEIPGGPYGSIGVAVTPYRTLATDKEVYPRGCLAFADTRLPQNAMQYVSDSLELDYYWGRFNVRLSGKSPI